MSAAAPVAPPQFGEPAPLFLAATDGVDRYGFDGAGGRWIVLMVFATLERDRRKWIPVPPPVTL